MSNIQSPPSSPTNCSPPINGIDKSQALASMEQGVKEIHDDEELELINELDRSDVDTIKSHNISYKLLLNLYLDCVGSNLIQKRDMKNKFFTISCATMIGTAFLEIGCIILAAIFALMGKDLSNFDFASLISVSVSFLTVYIVIPKIIAEHLFNNNDEDTMSDIIKYMLNHDRHIRNVLKSRKQDKSNDKYNEHKDEQDT